jgi:hypothetical protein
MAASMKMTVFWVAAPASSVEVNNVSEVLAASIITPHHSDDGGSKHLSNFGQILPDYIAQ